MLLPRLIVRLDVKGQKVVKGVQLEGLRVVGDPEELATKYAEEGMHEIYYNDCVASLYGRNQLTDLLERTTRKVFIPVTVGGGIKSRDDVQRLLRAGADAVAINTAAIKTPRLVKELSDYYGSQAITVAIEAKRKGGSWEAYTDNGREKSGRDVVQWAEEAVSLGAGQIIITSVDREGTMKGPDMELAKAVKKAVTVPVVVSGGVGSLEHINEAITVANGVAIASVLHYNKIKIEDMPGCLKKKLIGAD